MVAAGEEEDNTMHINAAASDCSPPGVSQMSVNIQLLFFFPVHLGLTSLWLHFISLPSWQWWRERSAANKEVPVSLSTTTLPQSPEGRTYWIEIILFFFWYLQH